MIELARSTYPKQDFQNVSFRQIDARNLPFDKELDVIFSNATLHWIQNHYPVLRESTAVLILVARFFSKWEVKVMVPRLSVLQTR